MFFQYFRPGSQCCKLEIGTESTEEVVYKLKLTLSWMMDKQVLSYDMPEVTTHILHRYKQCDPDSYYRFKQWGINKLVKY